MVKLIIEDDEGKTTVVPLIRDEISIGRKEGNTIRLTERNVSRRHAKLVKQNGAIFIEDLNSYNGIKVNGNRISGRVAIAEGDRIQIGDYVLGLKLEAALEAAASAGAGNGSPPTAAALPDAATAELARPDDAPTTELDVSAARGRVAAEEAAHPSPSALPAPKAEREQAARLVCVSTNFPGQEWWLGKPIMVLGRTDDNDVVINHRSISRHHARVVEEHGRYTIHDLQSSNGVRVNGEEYGKVELRRGDLVDLGHVRLRYVAPGEPFNFQTDASLVDISGGRRGRAPLWATLSLIAAAAVGFLVWRHVNVGTTAATDAQMHSQADRPQGASSAAADQTLLVKELKKELGSEQWPDALATCEKLSGAFKASSRADCEKARIEKTAKENFEKANSAHLARRYLEAIRHRNLIPETSTYRSRDVHLLTADMETFLTKSRADLAEAVKARNCDEADKLADEITEVEPGDSGAKSLAAKCSRAAVVTRPVEPRLNVAKKTVAAKKPDVKREPTAEEVAQAEKLLEQASDAYGKSDYKTAIALADRAVKSRALGPQKVGQAVVTQGLSACQLGNERVAKRAYQQLATQSRNQLKTFCMKYGVSLE